MEVNAKPNLWLPTKKDLVFVCTTIHTPPHYLLCSKRAIVWNSPINCLSCMYTVNHLRFANFTLENFLTEFIAKFFPHHGNMSSSRLHWQAGYHTRKIYIKCTVQSWGISPLKLQFIILLSSFFLFPNMPHIQGNKYKKKRKISDNNIKR